MEALVTLVFFSQILFFIVIAFKIISVVKSDNGNLAFEGDSKENPEEQNKSSKYKDNWP